MNVKKPPPPTPSLEPSSATKKSGRVSFDARGNAVWEWAMKTGSFKRDIDTKRLEALAATHLEIDGSTAAAGADPYNSSRSPSERSTPLSDKLQRDHSGFKSQGRWSRLWPFKRSSNNED